VKAFSFRFEINMKDAPAIETKIGELINRLGAPALTADEGSMARWAMGTDKKDVLWLRFKAHGDFIWAQKAVKK
jgi:hypothetical protein